MKHRIDIQTACLSPLPIDENIIVQWAEKALEKTLKPIELTIRFVETKEMQHLNLTYRNQNKTTNVLAFPTELPKNVVLDFPFIGDIVVCPAVLKEESLNLKQPLTAHWCHIIIHGVLHLLGFDHVNDDEALIMEQLETQLLFQLGFNDPYQHKEEKIE